MLGFMNSSSARALVLLLQQFAQATDRYVESTGYRHHLHRTDLNALTVILRFTMGGNAPTPGELSRELGLSAPATSALLERLENKGYVERLRIDEDRRVVRIRLTQKAKTEGQIMFAPLAASMMEVITNYAEKDITLMTRFMTEAISGVDNASKVRE